LQKNPVNPELPEFAKNPVDPELLTLAHQWRLWRDSSKLIRQQNANQGDQLARSTITITTDRAASPIENGGISDA
jgi:hypothetical protein